MSGTPDPVQTAGPEALGESRTPREAREVAPGVHFLAGFGNTTLVVGSEGVAVVDPGLFANGPRVVAELRRITDLPVRFVVYTHGHYDHAFGTPALLEDAAARGHDAPDIIGHVNVAKRFDRYARTAGHLATTFDAQFAIWDRHGGDVVRNAVYCPPTIAYEDRLELDGLGGQPIECRHGLGETDDHTWVWVPGPKVIVGGDFVVSSLPNAVTPFRVQRYVLEWAEALEEMASLDPAAVVSGHGGVFREHAKEMLHTTARALRYLDGEVVRRLNEGSGRSRSWSRSSCRRTWRTARTSSRSTGARSSPCATSCAGTWAGTTATRRCSSRAHAPMWPTRWWPWPAAPGPSSTVPGLWPAPRPPRTSSGPSTWSTSYSSTATASWTMHMR